MRKCTILRRLLAAVLSAAMLLGAPSTAMAVPLLGVNGGLVAYDVLPQGMPDGNFSWQQMSSDVLSSAAQSTSLYVVNGGAYVSAVTGSRVKVLMGNGSSWEQLLDQPTTANYTSLFIDKTGRPYVAYSDSAATGHTKVMKFSMSWTSLEAPVPAANQAALRASYISLSADNSGTPYVAANQNNMSGRVSVSKYNGSAWEYVGNASVSGDQAYSASMDVYNGTPYVAYCVNDTYASGAYVTMKGYDGSQWYTLGGKQISTKKSSDVTGAFVSMKISSSGTPYVAYADPGTGNRLAVKKLSEGDWVTVGGGYLTAGEASCISLSLEGETPCVAYKEGGAASNAGVTVKKLDAQSDSWATLGNTEISGSGNAKGISLFVDSGIPYISFSTNSVVKVMKFAEAPKQPVTLSPGSASVTYAGSPIGLSSISGLFTVDSGAGARTYTLETAPSEGSGEGQINGTSLSVTKAGVFKVGLETAESTTHLAGSKAIATLTVEKGMQNAPSGLGATNASTSSAGDGKITGLTSGIEYEYKLVVESSYIKATANTNGEITDLPVGAYVVRYPDTPVYNASADSAPVTVGDATSLTYSAAMNPTSYTFAAATVNYTQPAEQQFTITNNGTETITGLSASLNNADFTITNMVIVSQIAPNGTATIGVEPKTGLAAGTHTGTLTVTGAEGISLTVALSFTVNKIQTVNTLKYGSTYNNAYNGTPWELIHWINYGPSNGQRVYTLEPGTTGQGFFNGSQLNFTDVGTFVVGLVTEETDIYAKTEKILFTLNISKGTIYAPNIGAVNTAAGSSNGKITGLMANKECEYKLSGASSYTSATSNANGQITGLPAGTYVVRYPDNDLHAASPDSNSVTIGEDPLPSSAAVSESSHTFTAAAFGYGPQQAQEFTITNNGGSTITNLSASLTNGEGFTISTPLSGEQLAPNATATVSIQPDTGLTTGTHNGTLSITGDDGISLTVELTFVVNKADQNSPEGYGAENATVGNSDGKIINLIPGARYEYRLITASAYSEATSDTNGKITGLPAGEYYIRFAETELYNASPDSSSIVIVEAEPQSSENFVIAVTVPAGAVVNQEENTITATADNSVTGLTVAVTVSTGASWKLYSDLDCTHEISGAMSLNLGLNTFYIKVTAQNGNVLIYTLKITRQTGSGGSGSGDSGSGNSGSGGSGSTGASDAASVIVNGESKSAGKAQTTTGTDGKTTKTVTVDSGRLESILASEKSGATVVIPVAGNANKAAGVLTGQMVKIMEKQAATLEVRTDSATYTLPASEIDITAVSQQLSANVELKDITVAVSISEPSSQMAGVVENAAKDGGFSLMLPPVDYTVNCSYGGRTVSVNNFNVYVERTVAIPDGVDPAKITTGIVVNPDGTFYHVPTRVTIINGKYYAVINSLTNSTYSVVWNPVEFSDVNRHWAKASANNMGSRMVVTGVGADKYEPDRNMTRAEFATVIVKALGLKSGIGSSSFGDVDSSMWYSGYIKTAVAYGIIKGYNSDTFGPEDMITREQAFTMLANAMKTTGLNAALADSDIASLLGTYEDGARVARYAGSSTAACLKTGIVSGRKNNILAPKAYVTRAEVAVMVEKLLQKSKLI